MIWLTMLDMQDAFHSAVVFVTRIDNDTIFYRRKPMNIFGETLDGVCNGCWKTSQSLPLIRRPI